MGLNSITENIAKRRYIAFVSATILVALALFIYEIGRGAAIDETAILPILMLSFLAFVAAGMAVEFSPRVSVTVVNLPILLAIVFTGPVGAGTVAICGTFFMARKWPLPAILFNISIALIEVILGANLFIFLEKTLVFPSTSVTFPLVFSVALCALVMHFINLTFMSAFRWAKYRQSIHSLWRQNFVPAFPSQMIIIGIGLVILAIYIKAGLIAAGLFFIPIFASQHVFKLLVQQKELLKEQKDMSQDLMNMNIGLAGALIMLLDSKDHYTARHSATVALYCRDMATMMGMSEEKQHAAHMAGLLHDLGKVGTPDSVLRKEGELTDQEWEQIKQHPTTAAEALSQLTTHKDIANIIRHHQEHFDGSGYPYNLAGDEIPELSRMLAVADTYHALTSDRPYRAAMSPFEALITLRRVAGSQLDPKYVEVMAQVLKNEDLSYREGSKTDFLSEFRKGRPAFEADALRPRAEEQREIHPG